MLVSLKSPFVVMLLAGVITFPSFSQRLDLATLLEQSRKNYPSIKAKEAEMNSANREVNLSASDYIPKLAVQHQYTYGTSNSLAGAFYPNPAVISPSGGIRPGNTYTATWGSYTSAILEWNVFNFGKVAANVHASKANLENSEAAYENEIFQHQIRVADAYLLTLIAEKLSTIQRSNLERARHFRDVVDAGVRSGMRPGVDSSLAHTEYIKAELLVLDSKRNEKAQAYRLNELSGIFTQDLPQLDSMEFYTAIPISPYADSINSLTNPLLRFYRTRADATAAKSIALKRSFLPSISLVGAAWARGSGISPSDDSFKTDFSSGTQYQVYNYLVGVSTRWTLTDLVPVRQRYKSEKYKTIRDREVYNEQSLRLERQLKESDMQYDVMVEQVRTAPTQLAAARQAYQQASARYRSGLTDLPTLLQSMLNLNRAEADMAIAFSNVWRSLLGVAAAKGDLSVFLNAVNN